MDENVTIRTATVDDAETLLGIYSHYVANTAVSFELAVPTADEFARRIATTLERYPYLVAEDAHGIIGYAYAGPFKGRASYDWSCETSVYLAPAARRRGVGRGLYEALESQLRERGILNAYACIACPRGDDEHLTWDSFHFHEHMGYALAGTFHQCASKFGRWYDMVWMEKHLGEHPQDPERPFQ